jgi:hypothetical protein
VVGVGPAALEPVLSTAIADGSIANENEIVIASKDLLILMIHQNFCVGI